MSGRILEGDHDNEGDHRASGQERGTRASPPDHGHGGPALFRGNSIFQWLHRTFVHAHELVDAAPETCDQGIWTLKVSLAVLGLTALLQLAIVLPSGSLALLADTIHNLGDALTSIPLWIAFALARRGRSRAFPYGYGRAEDIAGTAIVVVIFCSVGITAYESLLRLFNPQPFAHPWLVAAMAAVGFAGNEAAALLRLRVGRAIGSAALVTDGQHSRVDGFTSLAVLIGVLGVVFGVPVLDPLVGLGISIVMLFVVKDAALAIWRRLMDGIEPEILAAVEHAPLHVPGVLEVHEVRGRWLGHRVHADLHIAVDPGLSVRQAHDIVDSVGASLARHVPSFGGAQIHVCPHLGQLDRAAGGS